MRKFQQVVIVTAAAGSLSAIGAGAGTAYADGNAGHHGKGGMFRPYQECSPQTLVDNNLPFGVLNVPNTFGTNCAQFNHAFAKK
ncbi:hypothetical protein [Streptomyces natalensis]|uniref:Chaplin domain-containing protein n=1 Tax=Streptomyces natalensis ATCC 27448 TaxID=1240678 RepID=A0A0D7CRM4_9ACTN|nr:hypothetical protein [Streptomyces natalensis]KIZ18873.1 hypothetical protein SNA_06345 [Streptomyces natalensis ATCC 27448]